MKSSFGDPPWRIADLAAQFGLATHVLRHWEQVGLLAPARDHAGRRLYDARERGRVAVIIRAKRAGMGLGRIREMLDADPAHRREVLEAHHAELERRIEEVRASQQLSRHALECEYDDFTRCPNFQALVDRAANELAPDEA